MDIVAAQQEVRSRYVGGFYGQLVSALLWLVSAALATWGTHEAAIVVVVFGGFLIFPATEICVRLGKNRQALSSQNTLRFLGMQVAFVLPLTMPLLVPVTRYRESLFFPGLMILLGAHYIPFTFLYGMRMFAALAALLILGGVAAAVYLPGNFEIGAWYTTGVLLVFAILGRILVVSERRGEATTDA